MAMTAPDLQPRYIGPRMGQLPTVHATDEAFGAADARNMGELAAVGQRAGLSILARAQEEQRRIDQAYVRDAMNQARMEMMERADAIFQKTGRDAENAPDEMAALLDGVKRRAGGVSCTTNSCPTGGGFGGAGGGGNIERQRMMDSAMQALRNDYMLAGKRHQLRERRAYINDTYDAQNIAMAKEVRAIADGRDIITGTAEDGGYAAIEANAGGDDAAVVEIGEMREGEPQRVTVTANHLPAEDVQQVTAENASPLHIGDAIAVRINKTRENVAMRYSGRHPEIIRQKQDEAENILHAAAIEGLMSRSPAAALQYLNEPRVREVIPPEKWEKYRSALKKGMAGDFVMQAMNDPEMTEEKFINGAWAQSDGDFAVYESMLKMSNSVRTAREGIMKAKAVKDKGELWGMFYDGGMKLENMPPDFIRLYPDMAKEFAGLAETFDKNRNANIVPQMRRVRELMSMAPADLAKWLDDKSVVNAGTANEKEVSNYTQLSLITGGEKKLFSDIVERAADTKNEGKAVYGAASFDTKKFFKAAFGNMFKTKSWWSGETPATFDAKSELDERRFNNFDVIFNRRLDAFENGPKVQRKATTKEMNDVATKLTREVRANPTMLDNGKFLGLSDVAAADNAPIAIPASALSPEQKQYATGDGAFIAQKNPQTGVTEAFQSVDKSKWFADDKTTAENVRVALQSGNIGARQYNAGDQIITNKRGWERIRDGTTKKIKSGWFSPAVEPEEPKAPSPAKGRIIQKLEENGWDVKWVPYDDRNGRFMAVNPEGVVKYFDENNNEIKGLTRFTKYSNPEMSIKPEEIAAKIQDIDDRIVSAERELKNARVPVQTLNLREQIESLKKERAALKGK